MASQLKRTKHSYTVPYKDSAIVDPRMMWTPDIIQKAHALTFSLSAQGIPLTEVAQPLSDMQEAIM